MELLDYIQRGGAIVHVLITLNIIGLSTIICKTIVIFLMRHKKDKITDEIATFIKNTNTKFAMQLMENEISKRTNALDFGLNIIKTIATISPLLGLLGTVVGVLNSFDTISQVGLGDPSLFSKGISVALITTIAGLIVSIPHYVFYNYFASSLDKLERNLQEEILIKI